MNKFLLTTGFIIALSGSAYAQSRQDFMLVNQTGYEISEVYVSTSKTDNWEEDVLGDGTLDDGKSRVIRFRNAGKSCMWDLKVVYEEDDSSAVWHDIDLCKTSKVTIKYNRKTDTTSAVFD